MNDHWLVSVALALLAYVIGALVLSFVVAVLLHFIFDTPLRI